ncbi:DUF4351 domain-containing protein [Steroidobacter sp. S1-65]|uniref:DUF4351 domain-containing protein n=1 Tax=Steroidobacter gossypii TaxID=2805490 RepID=A0ABS1WTG1_9GAMM|nr:DUF4351 domain-containing protein [Steroidobacter gossypii]MBM0104222.1 DUF4351 domain-containing protein [Steroidobacter gossypii]
MPSQLHETLLALFRNQPLLAPKLLSEALCANLPKYTDVSVHCANLTEIQPTEYRTDLVLRLSNGAPVLGIILEVQLAIDDSKRFTWPAYVATLRSRWRCPVCLLVVCDSIAVAQWAGKPIPIGCTNLFIPKVLGPDCVPEVTDLAEAAAYPELAVLAAMVHCPNADDFKAVELAALALGVSVGLDSERSELYFDRILGSLSASARNLLERTMPQFKVEYQSDFAKHYFAKGRSEGRVEGRAALIARQLRARFGPLNEALEQQLASSSIEELDAIGDRLLTAASLEEALTRKS